MSFIVKGSSSRWVPKLAYPSSATRLTSTAATVQGQTKYTYAADATITNVPCRIAPFIEERPGVAERTTTIAITYLQEYVLAFPDSYPVFKQTDRVIVDGVEYGVGAVEADGSKTYTRLRLHTGKRP